MKKTLLFLVSSILLFLLFIADILWGSVQIPLKEIFSQHSVYHNIIIDFRLPKAITAVVTGIAVSV